MNRFILWVLTSSAAGLGMAGTSLAQTSPAAGWETSAKVMQRNRDVLMSADFQKALPRLGTDFWVIAPASPDYNTWSHAAGSDRWVNVPVGTFENPFLHLDPVMVKSGFRRMMQVDTTFQPELEKVIVFGKPTPTGEIELTAAAVQHADGSYSAKLGRLAVIGFTRLDQITCPTYGVVMGVYVRPAKQIEVVQVF